MGITGRIAELWEACQVSHHGAYSLERLCAFSEYAQRHSSLRVFGVCLMTIIPPLVLVLLVDCIPQQDPSLGWKANWAVCIQILIRAFCMSFGIALELLVTAPAALFTIKSCALIALSTAIVYLILTVPIAIFVAFPIPFMFFSTAGLWDISFLLSVAIVVGLSRLQHSDEVKDQVKRFSNILMIQFPMVMIYPAFNMLYVRLDNMSRMALILLLPVVKFVLKNLLARTATGLDDYVPTLLLSIDFFNTIYQSKCLQGSGSHLTTVGVLLIDMVQNFISLRRLNLHVSDVCELQDKINILSCVSEANLLAKVLETCEHPEFLNGNDLAAIQLRSCATIQLPHQRNTLINTFGEHQLKPRSISAASPSRQNEKQSTVKPDAAPMKKTTCFRTNKVIPKNKIEIWPNEPTTLSAWPSCIQNSEKKKLSEQNSLLLKKTLQLLRRAEMLLLVEYVECAIPVLYATYLSILIYLPNAKYYPELNGRDAREVHESVCRILIYAMLELLTLIWVHFKLKRRFKFSALHQLAFALEQDRIVVQASFLCWALIIFQFTMLHNGEALIFSDW